MAKQSGLGDNAYIGGYNLSGDITALGTIRGGPAAMDVTAISQSAFDRIGGLRDGEISFTSWFNDATGQEHLALRGLPTTDVHGMYCRGTTLGNEAAVTIAKQVNYDGTRGADGSLSFAVQLLSNGYGLQWGQLLTAGLRSDTANTNGASVDFGTLAKTWGLQAFIQCTATTATTFTAVVQESSDDAVGDPFAAVTGGSFSAITTAPTSQRIATTAGLTVERYLRLATTGTWAAGTATFAVVVVVNRSATVF